jgi:hypothetical protein
MGFVYANSGAVILLPAASHVALNFSRPLPSLSLQTHSNIPGKAEPTDDPITCSGVHRKAKAPVDFSFLQAGNVTKPTNHLRGGKHMKAALVFTGSGPILILTSFDSIADPQLAEKLIARGINKFIAYEVAMERVQKQYGTRYNIILGDLSQTDDLRVLDIDGHRAFHNFSFEELGMPVYFPAIQETARLKQA